MRLLRRPRRAGHGTAEPGPTSAVAAAQSTSTVRSLGAAWGARADAAARSRNSFRIASAIERGVLHHPLHQLFERDAGVERELRYERRFSHPGLGIDFEAEQSPRPLYPVVVTEVPAAHTPAAERTMRSQC